MTYLKLKLGNKDVERSKYIYKNKTEYNNAEQNQTE